MNTNPPTRHHLSGARNRIAALLVGLALVSAAPAAAQQISPVYNVNPLLIPATILGNANGWDPVHSVYLVVGAYGPLYGVFADATGLPLTAPFVINGAGPFAHFPWVVYSPSLPNGAGGTGAFLVSWHENDIPPNNYVNTRVVSYAAGGPVGAQQTILDSGPTFWLSPPIVKYSTISSMFMVVWRSADYVIWGARLNSAGNIIGSSFPISPAGLKAQDPSLAWDSTTDRFAVMYTGFGSAAGTSTTVSIVSGTTVLNTNTFNFAGGNGTFITDIAYNSATGHYVGVWYQAGAGTMGAEIDANGNIIAEGPASTTTGTYDGLGIAYNTASGTFLLVGHGQSYNIWGAELNSRGARDSADQEITSAGGPKGSFYPMVAARANGAHWNVSFSHNFVELHDQIVSTYSTGGGLSGTLGGAPPSSTPPPTSGGTSTGSTTNCPGYPTPAFPGAVCVNGGWVPGGTSSGGTTTTTPPPTTPPPTTSCPGTAPFPGAVCVNGGWVPGGTSSGGTTTTTTSCSGSAPFPGAVCVNGGWVPGTTSSSTSCPGYPTPAFPGAVCVNGGWVPGTGGTTTTTTTTAPPPPTTSCPGTAPFPGAVCVNGGWVPGTSSTSTSCPGYPTPAFPGAVCVNGGWVPGGTTTTTSGTISDGTCTTPDPFTAIGGGICSGGGWRPKT